MTSPLYDRIGAMFDSSPESWIAGRVHRLYSYNPKLSGFLEGRIYLLHDWQAVDRHVDTVVSQGPVMHIAPHISSQPTGTPTLRQVRTVETIVSLQWEEIDWEPVHPSTHPSSTHTTPGTGFGDILDYAWSFIAHPDNQDLRETRTDTGEEVNLVSPGKTNRSVQDLQPVQKDPNSPWILGLAMILQFEVYVDLLTGKIENLR